MLSNKNTHLGNSRVMIPIYWDIYEIASSPLVCRSQRFHLTISVFVFYHLKIFFAGCIIKYSSLVWWTRKGKRLGDNYFGTSFNDWYLRSSITDYWERWYLPFLLEWEIVYLEKKIDRCITLFLLNKEKKMKQNKEMENTHAQSVK